MNKENILYFPEINDIKVAADTVKKVSAVTPLGPSQRLSKQFGANIYLKREDLQQVRSYKIRGAYNKISSLTSVESSSGVVCASAGNHAQGVALSCKLLQIRGTVYMPAPTPNQKVEQVKMFGEDFIEIKLIGDTFDDAYHAAMEECKELGKIFIHPFNDKKVIEGQATIGLEILKQAKHEIDYVFLPVGGGGLAAGLSTVFKTLSPQTKIIGVEPEGAPSMTVSIKNNKNTELESIEKFIDGAAVKRVGDLNFTICKAYLDDMLLVPEGKVCQTILELYNKDAIVVEPAGALSISALDFYAKKIKGKQVVCVVSGSNNDITRTPEIKERALLHANLKHYFIINFPQRAGALKEFVVDMLGDHDDITYFQYAKKTNRENGSAVVGVQLKNASDLEPLIAKLKRHNFFGEYLNNKPDLFQFLV
ncbi:threonine ammonia-lyase IlvA [Cognatitamlana onchidii]|uniref:threonine ammonia-lyase IlvA n=1 Tax=Cognatitamlana onchidii TaxID=2562860 RepID=UPI0010A5B101|nr:threonine ammonia-lyase IlvA [Algibacter onchidii]